MANREQAGKLGGGAVGGDPVSSVFQASKVLSYSLFTIQQLLADFSLRVGTLSPEALAACVRALPPSILNLSRRIAFRRTLLWAAKRSSFYREKLRRHGIRIDSIRGPEDMGEFYLSAAEVRETPDALLCDSPELVIESSGTTGHVTRVFLSNRELDYNARQGIILKAIYGICKRDRVLSTFDYGFCLDGQIVQRSLPYWKTFGICVGRADPVEIYRKLSDYRFNVVMSGTPWLSRLTEVAETQGRPFPLKLLIGGGGGGITQNARSRIESFWEAPLCMTYGSAEAGTVLGFECLHRNGYHLNEFDFFVEIPNPDGEGYGEVVITTVGRRVMPLIRYRTRDVARLEAENCPCGLPFRRLSPLRGRADEIIASVWGNVHPDFFEKILGGIPDLADDWQIALREKEGKQTFQFRLELKNGAGVEERIKDDVFSSLRREHPLAWQAQEQRLSGVEFAFHPKGTLRKGRKLLRLVDERSRGGQ